MMFRDIVNYFLLALMSLMFSFPLPGQSYTHCINECACNEEPCFETQEVCRYGRGMTLVSTLMGAGAGALTGLAISNSYDCKFDEKISSPFCFDQGECLTFNFCLDFCVCNCCPSQVAISITPYVMQPNGEICFGKKESKTLIQGQWCEIQVGNDRIEIPNPIFGAYHLGCFLSVEDGVHCYHSQCSTCSNGCRDAPGCTQPNCIQSSQASASLFVDESRSHESISLIFSIDAVLSKFFQCPEQQLEVTEFMYTMDKPKGPCGCQH